MLTAKLVANMPIAMTGTILNIQQRAYISGVYIISIILT